MSASLLVYLFVLIILKISYEQHQLTEQNGQLIASWFERSAMMTMIRYDDDDKSVYILT